MYIKTNTNTNTIVLLLLCTCTLHTLCEKHFYSKENEKQITTKKNKKRTKNTKLFNMYMYMYKGAGQKSHCINHTLYM